MEIIARLAQLNLFLEKGFNSFFCHLVDALRPINGPHVYGKEAYVHP
jgi:hypothetical protein